MREQPRERPCHRSKAFTARNSRLSFSRSAARTKSAMLTSSCRAARSISRNMAFGMRAWIGVLSAAVNTLPRLRFRRGLVCGFNIPAFSMISSRPVRPGFIGHQMPVRRDAALPGSGLSKKWPHRTKRPKRMGAIKKPAGEGGASGDANEPSGEGRTLGNLRATPIGKGHRGRSSVHEQESAQFGGGEGPAKRGEGRGQMVIVPIISP